MNSLQLRLIFVDERDYILINSTEKDRHEKENGINLWRVY